jgi:hypothetical protein
MQQLNHQIFLDIQVQINKKDHLEEMLLTGMQMPKLQDLVLVNHLDHEQSWFIKTLEVLQDTFE